MGEMISTIINVGLKQTKVNIVSQEVSDMGTFIKAATVQVGNTYLFLYRNELLNLKEELVRAFGTESRYQHD